MKTAYIQTDIEGVAGYVHYYSRSGSLWNFHHVKRMNRLLTREVNAAAKALKKAGYEEIYVNDNHGPAYNIDFEDLDPVCRIIHGRGGYGPSWVPMLERAEVAVAIGMHAMAGTPNANCNHSLWHLTDGNGNYSQLSEVGMFAHLCHLKGVKLVAISGDQFVCEEIRGLVPGCEAIEVKESLALEHACALHPDRACLKIEEGIEAALQRVEQIKMPSKNGPFKLNVSDRDPAIWVLKEDETGNDLWELMHRVCNINYAKFGETTSVGDRSWSYPDSVYHK